MEMLTTTFYGMNFFIFVLEYGYDTDNNTTD